MADAQHTSDYAVTKSDAEWREELSSKEYHVLREAGTERPFSSPFETDTTEAVYACRACGSELFRSEQKFDAHCGWPAFYAPLAEDRVEYIEDRSMGMRRNLQAKPVRSAGDRANLFRMEMAFEAPALLT